MLNKVQFIGRLGRNPETRVTQSGAKVVSFSLAVSEKYKDRNGQQQETTEWVSCTAFGKEGKDGLAGVIEKYLTKGSLIWVEGSLKTEKYQAQDGSDRYATKVILREMKMLGGGEQSGNQGSAGYGSNDGGQGGGYGGPDLSDEIPF